MARFKWLGENQRGSIVFGGTKILRVPVKFGAPQELTPIPPATEFAVGQDIGYDITDERSLRVLRDDSRFEEIL